MEGILDYTDITNDIKRYYGDQEGIKTIVLRYMDSVTGDILLTIERDAILGEKFEFTLPQQFEKDGVIYECLCKETQISQCIFEDIDATFAFTPQPKVVNVLYKFEGDPFLQIAFEIYKSYQDIDLCAPFIGMTDNPEGAWTPTQEDVLPIVDNLRYDIDYLNPKDIVVDIKGFTGGEHSYDYRVRTSLYSTGADKTYTELQDYKYYPFIMSPGEYCNIDDALQILKDGGVFIDTKDIYRYGIEYLFKCIVEHKEQWTDQDIEHNYDIDSLNADPQKYFLAALKHFVIDEHCLKGEFFTEVDTPAGKQTIQIKPIPMEFILHDTPEELLYNELNIIVPRIPTVYTINMVLPDETVVFSDTVEIYEDTIYTTPEVLKTIKDKTYKYQHFKYNEQYEKLNLTWFLEAGTSKNQTIDIPVEQMPTEYKLDYLACCLDHNGEIWDTHLIGSEWLSIMEDTEHSCSKVLELFKNADKHIAEFADGNIPSEPLEYDVQNWYDNPIIKTVALELLPTIWNVQFIDTDHTDEDAEPLMYEIPYNFYVYCWEDARELDAEILKKFLIQTLEGEGYPEYLKIKDLDAKHKLAWEADGEDIKHGIIEVEVERIPTMELIVYYDQDDNKVLYTDDHLTNKVTDNWSFVTEIRTDIKHTTDVPYEPNAVLTLKQSETAGDLKGEMIDFRDKGDEVYEKKLYWPTKYISGENITKYTDLIADKDMYSHIVKIPCKFREFG